MPTATIIVSGLVQGVGFRWFVQREAVKLGLTGTVENLSDGNVKVVAEGSREIIEQLIDIMYRGNGSSMVESSDLKWSAENMQFTEFRIVSSRGW